MVETFLAQKWNKNSAGGGFASVGIINKLKIHVKNAKSLDHGM